MALTFKTSLFFLLSFLTFTINAQLQGQWPVTDHPPPTKAEWTSLVDLSKVPNAPLSIPDECGEGPDEFCNLSCSQCYGPDDIVNCPSKGDWGITFDDGPAGPTNDLLDALSLAQINVTFFVVGSRVIEHPEILQKAISAGHQIGAHTWSHSHLTSQSNEEIIAEMKWTELAIKKAVGVIPRYMRPPFGDIDNRVREILSQLGYKVVIWDKDTTDYLSHSDKSFDINWIERNFTEWVKEVDSTGHISLEHDLFPESAAQGPKAISIVKDARFAIKPVALCLGDTSPYLETNSTVNPAVTPTPSFAPSPSPVGPVVVVDTPSVTVAVVTAAASNPDSSDPSGSASNAISYINNNNYLLVSFIAGIFITILI